MQLPGEGEGEGMIDDASVCLSVCLSVNPISYLSHLGRKKNVTCRGMSFPLVRFVGKLNNALLMRSCKEVAAEYLEKPYKMKHFK